MRPVWAALIASFVLEIPLAGVPRWAQADAIDACVTAAESGQKEQRAGQLRAARKAFLSCDRSECPAEVRTVCDRLLNAVETSVPTVIFGAKDSAGNDLVSVRVRVDGEIVAESMDGKAVPIDPGPHVFGFETAGSPPVEQRIVAREGEKNRPVIVSFAPSGVTVRVEEISPRRAPPALAYVFLGIGAAALGTFIGLDVNGQSRYSACQPHSCSSSTIDSLSAERDVAWALAGIGVLSLGGATWLFVSRSRAPAHPASVTLGIGPLREGGVLRAIGTF
jgi:hypothetical protein